jgi:hypothetical protein
LGINGPGRKNKLRGKKMRYRGVKKTSGGELGVKVGSGERKKTRGSEVELDLIVIWEGWVG